MSNPLTIFVSDGPWRLACARPDGVKLVDIDAPDDAEQSDRIDSVVERMRSLGDGGPATVALPSTWCLSAAIDVSDLGRSGRRQAMRYRLEEHLPLSAEDAVADFVEHAGVALGVAGELDRLRPLIDALQEADVAIKCVCPSALLAAAELADQHPDADAIAIESSAGIDFIELSKRGPSRWTWLDDRAELDDRLAAWCAAFDERGPELVTLGITGPVGESDRVRLVRVDSDRADPEQLAALRGAKLIAGEASAWIDLRRDALEAPDRYERYQRQFGLFAAALAFFLACVIGATFWRAEQYKDIQGDLAAEQIQVFKEALPGQRVPASIISRLQSEQRRLAGISGVNDNDPDAALRQPSALAQVHAVLAAWPDNLRYRLSDLTVEPNLVRINGQAADPVIPERLAALLRSTGAYEVDPPNTRALSDFGFSFGFIARPRADRNEEPGQ